MGTSLTCKDPVDGPLSGSFHETTNNPACVGQTGTRELNSPILTKFDRQQHKEISKTISLDRTNDNVYVATTKVVKAIMSLSQGVEKAAAVEYLNLVRHVGVELRALLSSVDGLASIFPSHALKYVLF